MSEDIFARSRLLWGDEGQDKLAAAHVTICGVGGVGAYAAEAIARCGVGEITLIDFDDVSPTNINRQLPALHSTVGRDKLDVMAERIRDINPACTLHLKKEFIDTDNVPQLVGRVDGIIDAIDHIPGKLALMRYAMAEDIAIVSAMGAGRRIAPEQLRIADISNSFGCPLARNIRRELKKCGIEKGVTVVFSPETAPETCRTDTSVIASCAFVPGTSGLFAASALIRKLLGIEL